MRYRYTTNDGYTSSQMTKKAAEEYAEAFVYARRRAMAQIISVEKTPRVVTTFAHFSGEREVTKAEGLEGTKNILARWRNAR